MSTALLFRDDAYLPATEATVVGINDRRGIILDRTVFYATGGGQPGDVGRIERTGADPVAIATAVYGDDKSEIVHVPAAEQLDALGNLRPGDVVTARIDWDRRRRHMRFHTATHLLCALVPHPVDGCSITAGYARLDFHMNEPLDKEALSAGIARFVREAHPVRHRWISEAELDADPTLVRSMSVQPPRGSGRVRVLEIEGVDLQPCGGTHVADTAEVGAVIVTKVEKKSAMTRRVVLGFAP